MLTDSHNGVIKANDFFIVPIVIPDGVSTATFDLVWNRDWSMFPTSDVDMIIFDPGSSWPFDGATSNAPERAVFDDPAPGTWWVLIDGYEIHKPDNYDLYLKLE